MSTGASARAKSTGKAAHERSADFARHYSLQLRDGGFGASDSWCSFTRTRRGGEGASSLCVYSSMYVDMCVYSAKRWVWGALHLASCPHRGRGRPRRTCAASSARAHPRLGRWRPPRPPTAPPPPCSSARCCAPHGTGRCSFRPLALMVPFSMSAAPRSQIATLRPRRAAACAH